MFTIGSCSIVAATFAFSETMFTVLFLVSGVKKRHFCIVNLSQYLLGKSPLILFGFLSKRYLRNEPHKAQRENVAQVGHRDHGGISTMEVQLSNAIAERQKMTFRNRKFCEWILLEKL